MATQHYVYIISDTKNVLLQSGVTKNLEKRMFEYRNTMTNGFISKCKKIKLVYFEIFEKDKDACTAEKKIRRMDRKMKFKTIKVKNPEFLDLYRM